MPRTVGSLCVRVRSWAGSRGSAQRTSSGAGPIVSGRTLEIAQLALPSNRSDVVDGLGRAGVAVEGDIWANHGGKATIENSSTLCRLWFTGSYVSGAMEECLRRFESPNASQAAKQGKHTSTTKHGNFNGAMERYVTV